MVDLETLGTRYDAPILSIGAVFFDADTGALGRKFYAVVDMADSLRYGKPSGDTIKWWLRQNEAARQAVSAGTHKLEFALTRFVEYCKREQDYSVWANGATFDISILDYAIPRVLKTNSPWDFWRVRDCRTIKEIAEPFVSVKSIPRDSTEHNALDDAVHQAKWVSAMWQALRKR